MKCVVTSTLRHPLATPCRRAGGVEAERIAAGPFAAALTRCTRHRRAARRRCRRSSSPRRLGEKIVGWRSNAFSVLGLK